MKKLIVVFLIFVLSVTAYASYTVGDMTIDIPKTFSEVLTDGFDNESYVLAAKIDLFSTLALRVEQCDRKYASLNAYPDEEFSAMISNVEREGKEKNIYNFKVEEYRDKNDVRYIRVIEQNAGKYRAVYGTRIGDSLIYYEVNSERHITNHLLSTVETMLDEIEYGDEWTQLLNEKPKRSKPNENTDNNLIIIIDIVLVALIVFVIIVLVIKKLRKITLQREETVKDCMQDETCDNTDFEVSESNRCKQCGGMLLDEDIYCPYCGKKVKKEPQYLSSNDSHLTDRMFKGLAIALAALLVTPIVLYVLFVDSRYFTQKALNWLIFLNVALLIVPALLARLVFVKDRIDMTSAFVYVWIVDIVCTTISVYKAKEFSDIHASLLIICSVISYLIFRKHDNSWQRVKRSVKYFLKNGFNAAYKTDRPCPFCGIQLKAGMKECPRCNGRLGMRKGKYIKYIRNNRGDGTSKE